MRAIKPNSQWVSFSKRNIMTKQFTETVAPAATFASIFNTIGHAFETPKVLMPVLSSLIVAVFGFAIVTSQALPGDGFYSLKQAYETTRISLLSPEAQAIAKVLQADQL